MENRIIKIIAGLVIIALFNSCQRSIDDFSTYMKYLANTENGLVKEKAVNGIKYKVKYLPNDYLIYKEINGNKQLSEEELKQLKDSYSNTITFMMIMGPDDDKEFDITKVGVSNYEEFSQRLDQLNFGLTGNVKINVGTKELYADLMQMESTYGLEKERKILFAFKGVDEQGNQLLTEDFYFTYNDEIFYTGMNKFKFEMNDLEQLPEFKF